MIECISVFTRKGVCVKSIQNPEKLCLKELIMGLDVHLVVLNLVSGEVKTLTNKSNSLVPLKI